MLTGLKLLGLGAAILCALPVIALSIDPQLSNSDSFATVSELTSLDDLGSPELTSVEAD